MEKDLLRRRERRRQTTSNVFQSSIPSKLIFIDFQNKIEEEKELEFYASVITDAPRQDISKRATLINRYTSSKSLFKLEIDSTPTITENINTATMYTNASTKDNITYPEVNRIHSERTTKNVQKTEKKSNSLFSSTDLVFLDFSDLKQKMERINKNITDKNFLLIERIRIENLYRESLISIIKTIDNIIKEKENTKKDIIVLQTKITQTKMKIDETLASFKIFQQAAQKQCSTVMFTRFCAEKDRVTKLINSIKVKQDAYRSSLNEKKEYEYELSLKLKEFKSLKIKNASAFGEYYNKLLEEANDLRNEGLTWIVYKLLELGWNTDKCHFPSYFTKRHIQFLINYSKKRIELTQLKIIYDAIKKKYSLYPKREILKRSPNKMDYTSLGRNQSVAIQKFFSDYHNNKNNVNNVSSGLDGKANLKVNDFLKDLDSKEKTTDKNKMDNITKHISMSVDKETVDNIYEIKNQIEKVKKEVTTIIQNEIKVYQTDYDDVRIFNFPQYEKLYQILFGKYNLIMTE